MICPNCKKKKASGGIPVYLIIAIAAVIGVIIVILGVFAFKSGSGEKANNSSSEVIQEAEETAGDVGQSDDGSNTAQTAENTAEDTGSGNPLEDYYNEVLTDKLGIFDLDQVIYLPYEDVMYEWGRSYGYASFGPEVRGIVNHVIKDFDSDGDDEMLLIYIESSNINIRMYENRAGRIQPETEYNLAHVGSGEYTIADSLSGDVVYADIGLLERGGIIYIATDRYGLVNLLADGASCHTVIMHYENGEFSTDFDEDFVGSDDSGMEAQDARCRQELQALGFDKTAEEFRYLNMNIKDESGLERLFCLRGENRYSFEWSNAIYSYYDTYNVNLLGEIEYHFSDNRLLTHDEFGHDGSHMYEASDNSEFIFPDSNSRYLTMSDLYGMSAEECKLARNELFARHGRMFNDAGLQAYFNSKSWYSGYIAPEDFNESVFNDYEIANRDLIVEYEKQMGYR